MLKLKIKKVNLKGKIMIKRYFYVVVLFAVSVLFSASLAGEDNAGVVKLKIGHVGHDHHLALFVAADLAEQYSKKSGGITLKKIKDKKFYTLAKKGRKLADVEIIKVGGGSKMPTALAQNIIDMGCGGIAPILCMIDKGAPIKLISPLHSKGDMFVMAKDSPVNSWQDFVKLAKSTKKPIRIGYKNASSVAKIIFEDALKSEGITSSTNSSDSNVQVHLINVKGGGKLNISLANGVIDGYTGNNPFPAMGEAKGILKVISDLEDLPPGRFKNHPCCGVAASNDAMNSKREAVEAILILMHNATETINSDPETAAKIAARWIGTTVDIEKKSIPTSGYSMEPSAEWHRAMTVWCNAMNKLGIFTKSLKNLKEDELGKRAYDFSALPKSAE
jgi:NitT/TauT family transport system substrate-binding protein